MDKCPKCGSKKIKVQYGRGGGWEQYMLFKWKKCLSCKEYFEEERIE